MKYFEYNLPKKAPDYLDIRFVKQFERTMKSISARMDKLENALIISGLDGATFSGIAKKLFDNFFDSFEKQTASQLAAWVVGLHDGTTAEPRMEWPNAMVVLDSAFVTTKEWEMVRHIGIGGSDAAVIMGLSPYRTPRELYYDKCGIPEKITDDGKQKVFDRGHILEPSVINAFCSLTGAKVIPETRMFCSARYPNSTANIDAIIQFPNGDIFVYEAKSTIKENFDAWSYDKIPDHYVPQCRQYPAVLADDRIKGTYIGCLFTVDYELADRYVGSSFTDEDFVARFVARDDEREDRILKAEETFWNDYIECGVEPPLSGNSKKDIDALRTYTGPADTSLPVLDFTGNDTLVAAAAAWREIKDMEAEHQRRVDELKEKRDAIAAQFIEALGQTIEGRIDLGHDDKYLEIKYAPRKSKTVDYEKMKLAYPKAYEDCVTDNPDSYRVFSMREKTARKKRP